MFKVVFFDCDGVLSLGNSWVKLHNAVGLPKELDKEWYDEYTDGKITAYEWAAKIEKFYKSRTFTNETLQKIISTIQINPEAKYVVDFLHKQSIPMAIISASFDMYVKYVANRLGISIWKTNYSFKFNSNDTLLKINALGDESATKVNQVKEVCGSLSISPEETIFIGDSFNDVGAFRLTKHGLLYKNNQLELEKYAWKKISDLKEIISLL